MKKIILSTFILLFLNNQSFAVETLSVKKFIKVLGDKIISIADNEKLDFEQKKDELATIVDSNIDINWISKFVLGRHYRIATIQQKEQFKKLYHQFIINSYIPKFIDYNNTKFTIIGVSNNGNYHTVKCIFNFIDKPEVSLDFRVRKAKNNAPPKFLVFDFLAEKISLIETQRSEFGSVISQKGLDAFLVDFKEKVEEIKN